MVRHPRHAQGYICRALRQAIMHERMFIDGAIAVRFIPDAGDLRLSSFWPPARSRARSGKGDDAASPALGQDGPADAGQIAR